MEQLRNELAYVIDYGNQKFVSIGWFPLFVVDETGKLLYEGKDVYADSTFWISLMQRRSLSSVVIGFFVEV